MSAHGSSRRQFPQQEHILGARSPRAEGRKPVPSRCHDILGALNSDLVPSVYSSPQPSPRCAHQQAPVGAVANAPHIRGSGVLHDVRPPQPYIGPCSSGSPWDRGDPHAVGMPHRNPGMIWEGRHGVDRPDPETFVQRSPRLRSTGADQTMFRDHDIFGDYYVQNRPPPKKGDGASAGKSKLDHVRPLLLWPGREADAAATGASGLDWVHRGRAPTQLSARSGNCAESGIFDAAPSVGVGPVRTGRRCFVLEKNWTGPGARRD